MCCVGWFNYIVLHARACLASDQTSYFAEMVEIAVQKAATPKALDEYIEGVKNYYPSGTKQKVGSPLDVIVERARSQAVSQLDRQKATLMIRESPNRQKSSNDYLDRR